MNVPLTGSDQPSLQQYFSQAEAKGSSSSTVRQPGASFRQRLLTEPDDFSSGGPISQSPVDTNKAFFNGLVTPFGAFEKPTGSTHQYGEPETSPLACSVNEQLITGVREDYGAIAADLYTKATTKLDDVHKSLEVRLDTMMHDDVATLSALTKQHRRINRPFSDTMLEIQITDENETPRTRVIKLSERVAEFSHRLNELETELEELWKGWEEAQAELQAAMKQIMDRTKNNVAKDWADDVFRSTRESVEKELEDLMQMMTKQMKNSEADFQKRIIEHHQLAAQQFMSKPSKYD